MMRFGVWYGTIVKKNAENIRPGRERYEWLCGLQEISFLMLKKNEWLQEFLFFRI